MGFFEECHKCKPPKRKPGCQDTCPHYKEDRAKYDKCAKKDKLRRELDRYNKPYPNN